MKTSKKARGASRDISRRPSTSSINSATAFQSTPLEAFDDADSSDDENDTTQDVQEVWFPGDHGDIGGGWPRAPGVKVNVSHIPLVWMLREAQRAGLPCDEEALQKACYSLDDSADDSRSSVAPHLQVDGEPVADSPRYDHEEYRNRFMDLVSEGSTKALVHDALVFGQHGISQGAVFGYRVMEWMPFRRMDLRPDGKCHNFDSARSTRSARRSRC